MLQSQATSEYRRKNEKQEKYQGVPIEIGRLWKTAPVVVPIVIGTCLTTHTLKKSLKEIGIKSEVKADGMVSTALLGSAPS